MTEAATTLLQSQQFEQALGILDRERPSPRDELRFRMLTAVVWGALVGTSAWVALYNWWPGTARPFLTLAVTCYILSVPMFFMNLGLAKKLLRAAAARRKFRLTERLNPVFRARRRQNRLYNATTFIVSCIGYLFLVFGILGFWSERVERDPWGLQLATVMFGFGLGCVFIHFMARGKERMAVIAELRGTLLAGRQASDGAVPVPVEQYDQIASIERAQLRRDRKRSIATALQTPSKAYVLRMSRALRQAMTELRPEELVSVNETIQELLVDPEPKGARAEPQTDISIVPVPDTAFEIGFFADHERREIQLISLRGPVETGRVSQAID